MSVHYGGKGPGHLSRWPKGAGGFAPYTLFAGGEQGLLHNFRDALNLRQDSTGTTAAATGQPVGFAVDESQFSGRTLAQYLAAQTDIKNIGVVGLAGSATAATYNTTTGAGTVSRVDGSNQSFVDFTATTGSVYAIDVTAGGGSSFYVRSGGYTQAISATIAAGQTITVLVTAIGGKITLTAPVAVVTASFTVNSFKLLSGYHAAQATAGSRPTFNAGLYLQHDGTADNLLSTAKAGASGNTIALRINAPATVSATQVLGGLQASTSTRWYLAINTSGKLCAGVGTDAVTTVVGTTDIRGQSGTAVLVTTGTTVSLYWNGVLEYTGAQAGSVSTTIPYRIGSMNNNGTASDFTTADIYFALAIQRALTLPEITSLTSYWSLFF